MYTIGLVNNNDATIHYFLDDPIWSDFYTVADFFYPTQYMVHYFIELMSIAQFVCEYKWIGLPNICYKQLYIFISNKFKIKQDTQKSAMEHKLHKCGCM